MLPAPMRDAGAGKLRTIYVCQGFTIDSIDLL